MINAGIIAANRIRGGGGGIEPAWTYSIAPELAVTRSEAIDDAVPYQEIALPAGSVTKLGAELAGLFTGLTVKIGLFDAGKALVISGSAFAGTAGDSWWECAVTPTGITAATYYIGFIGSNAGANRAYLNGTGTTKRDGLGNYAAFPPNPFAETSTLSRTYAVGAFIE